MKWRNRGDRAKQSISSTTSMSFLTDEKLTFHRFSDGRISFDRENRITTMNGDGLAGSRRSSNVSHTMSHSHHHNHEKPVGLATNYPIWTTKSSLENYNNCEIPLPPPPPELQGGHHNKYYGSSQASTITSTNDTSTTTTTRAIDTNTINTTVTSDSFALQNGSKMKLLNGTSNENLEDQPTKQSRCSIFRGVVLCLCLNLTYSNIVRFPRELERHGSSFLVPYLVLLFIIGLPLLLLEISLGQFLGQGSAHTWRASPFFKGASIVARIASWLSAIWISMQSTLALLYIGMLSLKSVPFSQCANARLDAAIFLGGYISVGKSGQECLKATFLQPVWKNSLYFGFLAIGLMLLWVVTMVSTHSAKINRRSIFLFGFLTLMLLIFQAGWEVTRAINQGYFPNLWPFNVMSLGDSSLWFNALVQVIFSLNIGAGIMPVVTGKFLYKSDAVKTSFVYVCFNILITAIATIFYLMQFENPTTPIPSQYIYPELSTLSVIYDRALTERDHTLARLIPGLSFAMIALSSLISMVVCVYTATRMMRRHPNYTVCLVGLVLAISGLLCPDFIVARVMDSRVVGSLIVCALIFDVIGTIWIYGSKNLYTDLEFSIGRPIFKIWLLLWSLAPIVLATILVWWLASYTTIDLIGDWLPRWLPIVISLVLIFVMACVEVGKQVDYNLCSMITGAAKPSKDWGPSDPLVRHAWKQWKSVCEDTGERDFTLRRRGTKDYTNSIKKGQYSHSNKYGTANRKHQITRTAETDDSNSPNYSGSVFGDSAIEEDISVDKQYSDFRNLGHYNDHTHNSSPRISANSSRSKSSLNTTHSKAPKKRYYLDDHHNSGSSNHSHGHKVADILFTHHPNGKGVGGGPQAVDYTSRIEITPMAEGFYKTAIATNTIPRVELSSNYGGVHHTKTNNPLAMLDNNYSTYQNAEIYGRTSNPKSNNSHHYSVSHNNNNNSNNNNNVSHKTSAGSGAGGGGGGGGGGVAHQDNHICWRKYSPHSDEFSTEL